MNQKLTTLLLDSLHQDQNRLDIPALKALSNEEWDELIALAIRMRVRLFFYQNLKKRGLEEIIPEEIAKSLKEFFTHNTIRNLRYLGELNKIVNAFAEKNIPVIALKGIYLADVIYENIGLREMNDIDLLVPKEELAEAVDAMINLGYKTKTSFSPNWELTLNWILDNSNKPV